MIKNDRITPGRVKKGKKAPYRGIEPRTFGLEVQRASTALVGLVYELVYKAISMYKCTASTTSIYLSSYLAIQVCFIEPHLNINK